MALIATAVLGFFCVLYYYQYLKACKRAVSPGYNNALLIMGCLVSMGMAMVGCNQRPNIAVLHAIGALMAFLIGAAYCCMVTWQTFVIRKSHEDSYA